MDANRGNKLHLRLAQQSNFQNSNQRPRQYRISETSRANFKNEPLELVPTKIWYCPFSEHQLSHSSSQKLVARTTSRGISSDLVCCGSRCTFANPFNSLTGLLVLLAVCEAVGGTMYTCTTSDPALEPVFEIATSTTALESVPVRCRSFNSKVV